MSDTSTLFTLLADRLRRRLLVQLCAAPTLRVPEDLTGPRPPVLGVPAGGPGPDDGGSVPDCGEPPDSPDDELLIELRHVHLPKLEAAGAIEWETDDRISRGPKFEEYEPALRTMIDAADTFPDQLI